MLFCRRQLPGYLASEVSAQTPEGINSNMTVPLVCTSYGNNLPHVGRHRRHLCSKLSQKGGKWQCCKITKTDLTFALIYPKGISGNIWKESVHEEQADEEQVGAEENKFLFLTININLILPSMCFNL